LVGLEACTGVAAELFARRGYSSDFDQIPVVAGAVIYDFGPRRGNAIYPDKALGRAAQRAAESGKFPLGPVGAGRSAGVAPGFDWNRKEPSGQGAAFRNLDGDVLFCLSTQEVDNPQLSPTALAVLGAELAWDGILASF
jgi:L-aminopeptidase/D-esterase-like protein